MIRPFVVRLFVVVNKKEPYFFIYISFASKSCKFQVNRSCVQNVRFLALKTPWVWEGGVFRPFLFLKRVITYGLMVCVCRPDKNEVEMKF